jgi:hypothetical protein
MRFAFTESGERSGRTDAFPLVDASRSRDLRSVDMWRAQFGLHALAGGSGSYHYPQLLYICAMDEAHAALPS